MICALGTGVQTCALPSWIGVAADEQRGLTLDLVRRLPDRRHAPLPGWQVIATRTAHALRRQEEQEAIAVRQPRPTGTVRPEMPEVAQFDLPGGLPVERRPDPERRRERVAATGGRPSFPPIGRASWGEKGG